MIVPVVDGIGRDVGRVCRQGRPHLQSSHARCFRGTRRANGGDSLRRGEYRQTAMMAEQSGLRALFSHDETTVFNRCGSIRLSDYRPRKELLHFIGAQVSTNGHEGVRALALGKVENQIPAWAKHAPPMSRRVSRLEGMIEGIAKNDAVSAKDDAVSAKDTAVDAKNTAVDAKNTAVDAKDLAVKKAEIGRAHV